MTKNKKNNLTAEWLTVYDLKVSCVTLSHTKNDDAIGNDF